MNVSPLRLVIVTRDQAPHVKAAWDELEPWLRGQAGVELACVDHGEGLPETLEAIDLVVVLGGDGALLRACRQMGARQHPLLGVNLGRLGFLADLSPEEFRTGLPQLVERSFRIVRHLMYECRLLRADGTVQTYVGLNEVIVSAGASFHMIDVELSIDGEPVTVFSGDGLIVATPVGSTAHSLSAGGPILRQDLQAFVVTPICPHTLTTRPVVDGADRVYRLTLPTLRAGSMLLVDGQIHVPLEPGDAIEVRRAGVEFQLARLPGHSYYGTLLRKLGWDGRPRYRRGPAE